MLEVTLLQVKHLGRKGHFCSIPMPTSLLALLTSPVRNTMSNWQQVMRLLGDRTWSYGNGRSDKHVTKEMEVNRPLLALLPHGGVLYWQKRRSEKVIFFSLVERQEYLVDRKPGSRVRKLWLLVWTFPLDHPIHCQFEMERQRCRTPTCATDCHVIWQIQTFFSLPPLALTTRHMPLSINT